MELKEILDRSVSEKLYVCSDESLLQDQQDRLETLYDFNATRPNEQDKRQELLKKMFASVGDGCYIEPPLRCNWGGKHVHIGKKFYSNFNLTMIDECRITIGDNVMFATNVTLVTGTHPISPRLRKLQTQYNKPITIGDNVWLGANVVVMPGVSIGNNSVIGTSSIVTKDIPANVVAYGSPCKVAREITENDEIYYDKDKLIDI